MFFKYIAWWFIFGLPHSVLALETVKTRIPLSQQAYRIVYNLFSSLVFLVVLLNVPSLTEILLSGLLLKGSKLIAFLLLIGIGSYFVFCGLREWDLFSFLGLKKEESIGIVQHGAYKFTRHPVYLGTILMLLAGVIANPGVGSWSWLIGAGGYLVFGSFLEEKKLLKTNPSYREYRENVGRFFPWRRTHFNFLFQGVKREKAL